MSVFCDNQNQAYCLKEFGLATTEILELMVMSVLVAMEIPPLFVPCSQ